MTASDHVLVSQWLADLNGQTFLRLTLLGSKNYDKPIVTMEKAVDVDNALKTHHATSGLVGSANYALYQGMRIAVQCYGCLQQQFDHLLEDLHMKHRPLGEERTIYSLRHPCMMFRLRAGDTIDFFKVARNARTSVAMIDRFYAGQLTGEMNIDSIQSVRCEKNKLALASNPNIPLKVASGVMAVDVLSNSSPRIIRTDGQNSES